MSLEDIQQRHDIVDALVEDPLLRERLRNLHLRKVPMPPSIGLAVEPAAPVLQPSSALTRRRSATRNVKCGMGCSEHELSAHAGLPDVERLARKLDRRKASLADLCQLYRASSRLPMLVEAFRDYEGPHTEHPYDQVQSRTQPQSIFGMSMDCKLWRPHRPLPTKHCGLVQQPEAYGPRTWLLLKTCPFMQICRQAGGCP